MTTDRPPAPERPQGRRRLSRGAIAAGVLSLIVGLLAFAAWILELVMRPLTCSTHEGGDGNCESGLLSWGLATIAVLGVIGAVALFIGWPARRNRR